MKVWLLLEIIRFRCWKLGHVVIRKEALLRSTNMFWIRCLVLFGAFLLAQCYIPYSKDRCTTQSYSSTYYDDEAEDRPQPPDLCNSYTAKYELHSFYANHSMWVQEYFDHTGKRAKISASILGMEFVDIYNYASGTVTSYRLQRPESSGWSSKIEDTCETVEMLDFKPKFQVLSYPLPKSRRLGPQSMPTAYQAFKYGPPYDQVFVKYSADANSTRGIPCDIFQSCINEAYLNYSLRSHVYWGRKLPFSYPSGEKRAPLFAEMRGPNLYNKSLEEHVTKYFSWFQKDPEFTDEMFQIPKGLHCKYLSKRAIVPSISTSFSYTVEETKFELDASGFLKGGFRYTAYKKVWYDGESRLARIDMRPIAQDLEVLGIKVEGDTDHLVSALFDFNSGFTYVSYMPHGDCTMLKSNQIYFFKHENGSLKSSEELLGITLNLQYKGKTTVMGVPAHIWTELIKDSEKRKMIKREFSFVSRTKGKDKYNNKHIFALLQEAVYEEEYKEGQDVREFLEQNVTVKNYFEFNLLAPHQAFAQHACIKAEPAGSYYVNFKRVKVCPFDASNKARFLGTFRRKLAAALDLSTVLSIQNLQFRWINDKNISVGFTFHEGIPGQKISEPLFRASAETKVENSMEPLIVGFPLSAASESDDCIWESYLFHKNDVIRPQPRENSMLQKCQH